MSACDLSHFLISHLSVCLSVCPSCQQLRRTQVSVRGFERDLFADLNFVSDAHSNPATPSTERQVNGFSFLPLAVLRLHNSSRCYHGLCYSLMEPVRPPNSFKSPKSRFLDAEITNGVAPFTQVLCTSLPWSQATP